MERHTPMTPAGSCGSGGGVPSESASRVSPGVQPSRVHLAALRDWTAPNITCRRRVRARPAAVPRVACHESTPAPPRVGAPRDTDVISACASPFDLALGEVAAAGTYKPPSA
eukprot:4494133-Prymnesium_polylepis.2